MGKQGVGGVDGGGRKRKKLAAVLAAWGDGVHTLQNRKNGGGPNNSKGAAQCLRNKRSRAQAKALQLELSLTIFPKIEIFGVRQRIAGESPGVKVKSI